MKANAIKILMNSFYGVLGAGASRLFSPDVANAVTSLRPAADPARRRVRRAAQGYEVIYGDTDSLFVYPREPDRGSAPCSCAERLRVDDRRGGRRAHRRPSSAAPAVLELEFEKLYRRFFLPEVRGGKVGQQEALRRAARRRTGASTIEFVGLESVRRDWSEVSKRFQRELLQRVFHDEPVDAFIRGFRRRPARRRASTASCRTSKAIRKDLDAYTKTTPPHVSARAPPAAPPAGRIVAYVMTRNGPEPVGELTAAARLRRTTSSTSSPRSPTPSCASSARTSQLWRERRSSSVCSEPRDRPVMARCAGFRTGTDDWRVVAGVVVAVRRHARGDGR